MKQSKNEAQPSRVREINQYMQAAIKGFAACAPAMAAIAKQMNAAFQVRGKE